DGGSTHFLGREDWDTAGVANVRASAATASLEAMNRVGMTARLGSQAPAARHKAEMPDMRRDRRRGSALACLEALLGLVDDVDPALAPHESVVPMPATQ